MWPSDEGVRHTADRPSAASRGNGQAPSRLRFQPLTEVQKFQVAAGEGEACLESAAAVLE